MHWIVPQHPVLQKRDFNFLQKGKNSSIPSVIDQRHVFSTVNGRSALMLALKSMDLQPGDEVLLPAYHCPVMVHPIVNMGCTPVFYRINENTTVNLTDFQEKITKNTKAAILVHFFGFPSNITKISTICKKHRIYLIEDCSHCFWGEIGNKSVGSYGDFAIASVWKFIPVSQGGYLIVNNTSFLKKIHQQRNSLFFEFKTILNTIEMGKSPDRRDILSSLLRIKDFLWQRIGKQSLNSGHYQKKNAQEDPYALGKILDTYKTNTGPFIIGKLFPMLDQNQIIATRRRNYQVMLEWIANQEKIKPLFGNISEKFVPYVFPLLSDDADLIVNKLRKNGINVLRFGHFLFPSAKNNCNFSDTYSKCCVQIPIHQSLNLSDMENIKLVLK